MKNCMRGFAPYPLPQGGGGSGVTPEQMANYVQSQLAPRDVAINQASQDATQAKTDATQAKADSAEAKQDVNDLSGTVTTISDNLSGNNTITKANTALQKINSGVGIDAGNKVNNEQTVKLLPATQETIGGVKPDGTSITETIDGTISSQGGSGGNVKSVAGVQPDANGDIPLKASNLNAPTNAEMGSAINTAVSPVSGVANTAKQTADATNTALNNNDTINKANSALQQIDGDQAQGVQVSAKSNNKQTVSIDNASKTGKGVAQAGDNIDATDGVLSATGGGQGTVKSVAGVSPDGSGNVPLTAGNVGAYSKAQTDVAIGAVAASVTGLQTEVNAVKATANSATQQIVSTDNSVKVSYNGRNADLSVSASSQVAFDETMTIKQIATPKATTYSSQNYNYGTNWKADLRYISPLTDFGIFYVTILDTAPSGNTSGGSYGIYSSYSKDSYNDLVSGLGLTQSKIYSALTSTSSLTLNIVGKGQRIGINTPKSAYSGASDMNAVAAILQTQMRSFSFMPNATCIWNGNSLVLSSGTLDWNLALCEDLGGDCSNTVFSLVPNGFNEGANLVPNSFGGLLEVISFAAHDGSGNIAKIAKTYTSSGNKNQFIIEIYENGNYLPERGVYATLSYALSTSSLYGTNQNETYNNRLIGVWDNTKVQKIPSTEIDSVIALTMVNNKKASPYRTLYVTAVGSASGTLGDNTMMLIISLDYGCTNPIGQPIRVSQGGGGNGTYEDEYIELRFIWRVPEKASPYKNYIGNAPAFTIVNTALSITDANTLVQAGKANYVINQTLLAQTPTAAQLLNFTTTGLVNRGITAKIISRLSTQVYNNNFFIVPCSIMALDLDKSVIDNGGDFTVYLRMDVANYTQTFKTKIVIPFASGKNYTNCKFKLVLGQNMLMNGLPKTGIIDLTVPATINGGQTLFLEFEITYDNQNIMNINWNQSVLPNLSMAQELGSYAGKSDGQSNFALGMDAPITSFKITPEIGDVQGVQTDYQIINGLEYLTFTLEVGKIYNVIFGGLVAISSYLNTNDTPVYVGLVNIVQFRPDYWETYLTEVKFSTTSLKGKINNKKSILQIDMTQESQAKTFRLFFGTKTPVSGVRGVISDYLSVNFKDNADGV